MKKVLGCLLLIVMFCMPFTVWASDTAPVLEEVSPKGIELATKAKSAILIEETTGKVLYEKNSHEKLPPASMTKIMSMLIIIEHIESGALNWDDMVTVSENASKMGGSQILLETGEQMSVKDLFKGVAVASGNDAVVALAETVAGTEEAFVQLMNEKVKKLGLKDTVFKNPHGLDEADHYSSAYDMVMIGRELVKHKKVLEFTSIYEDYLRKGTKREFWLVNTNRLVKFNPIVDGLKTGFTSGAGYCLTATAKKNEMRLLATVMGEESTTSRTSEVTSLLDYGYANYKLDSILSTKSVIDTISVPKAKVKTVSIVPKKEVTVLNKKTDKLGEISYSLNMDELRLPIKKGDKVGTLEVKEDGKILEKIEVSVSEDLEKIDFFGLFMRYLQDILSGNMNI